jgi:phosphatidylglycerophosphate synthase
MEEIRATYKRRDSWWTVLLVDPIAGRLVQVAARYPWVTPNLLTAVAFLLGLGAAGSYLIGTPAALVAGVLLYHTGFVLDCIDGKIARLQGSGSIFGGWLDFFLDRIRVVLCVVALFAGQWRHTDDPLFLFLAMGIIFLALFGYVNGSETDKAYAKLAERGHDVPGPDDKVLLRTAEGPAAGIALQLREALHRRRIRMNLISGIELEMAVLVIAPLAVALTTPYALVWVSGLAAGLLILFELALIGRFWLVTHR